MDNKKRQQNEKKFEEWEQLPNGGRRYWYDVPGHGGWKARYVKEVDVDEITTKFYQEIYDDKDNLREIHEKYPEDKGHRKIGSSDQ